MRSYVENVTVHGEKVTYKATFSKYVLVLPTVGMLLGPIAFIFIWKFSLFWAITAVVISTALFLPGLADRIIRICVCRLFVSDRRIYVKYGASLSKVAERNILLGDVKNIAVYRSFVGKIFGYGSVSIKTDRRIIRLRYMNDPDDFKSAFEATAGVQFR